MVSNVHFLTMISYTASVSKKMRIFLVGLVLSLSLLCQAYEEPYAGKHLLVETEDEPYGGSDDGNEVVSRSLRSGGKEFIIKYLLYILSSKFLE